MNSTRTPPNLILFDGVCNLCAHSVQFVLAHEAAPVFTFVPVQSKAGMRLMRECGVDPADPKTFVFISAGNAYTKSDAAIRIARHFSGAWKWLVVLKIIPRPIRDFGYDIIANNRYRWFGRKESCMIPTPELRARFMEE